MPNGRPPIVWHLDTTQIDNKFDSPPDRLTVIKWVMQIYEADVISRKEAFKAFEKLCENQMTDKKIQLLLDKIQINAETRIDEVLESLGIIKD